MLELEPNLADEQLMEIVEEVDEDGSGTIDFDGNVFDHIKVDKILLLYIKSNISFRWICNNMLLCFYRIHGNDDGINEKENRCFVYYLWIYYVFPTYEIRKYLYMI